MPLTLSANHECDCRRYACSILEITEGLANVGNATTLVSDYRARRKSTMYPRELLTACERHLFAASSRKIHECLSYTPTIDRFVCAMEFGIRLLPHAANEEENARYELTFVSVTLAKIAT